MSGWSCHYDPLLFSYSHKQAGETWKGDFNSAKLILVMFFFSQVSRKNEELTWSSSNFTNVGWRDKLEQMVLSFCKSLLSNLDKIKWISDILGKFIRRISMKIVSWYKANLLVTLSIDCVFW